MNFRKYYHTVLKICYCTYFSDPHNKYICTGNEVGWTCKDITLKKKKDLQNEIVYDYTGSICHQV